MTGLNRIVIQNNMEGIMAISVVSPLRQTGKSTTFLFFFFFFFFACG